MLKNKDRLTLREFNKKFSKIIDELEKSGLNYSQIESVLSHTFREKKIDKMICLINMNWTQSEIAKHFGVTHSVVSLHLSKYYNDKMNK